ILVMSRLPPCATLFPYTTLFRSFGVCVGPAADGNTDLDPDAVGVVVREGVALPAGADRQRRAAFGRPRRKLERRARALRLGSSRSEEHTSELQSRENLVCRLLLE